MGTVRAYVLIQTGPGRAARVARTLEEIPQVDVAEKVTGPFDLIVQAEVTGPAALRRILDESVHPMEGVIRVLPCLAPSGRDVASDAEILTVR